MQDMAWLNISTSQELVRFSTSDIVFIHADGNYSDVFLQNGKSRKMTFKLHYFDEALQRIEKQLFVRVGKSLIVNKDYISVINPSEQRLLLDNSRMPNAYDIKASKEALKDLKAQMDKEGGNA